MKKAAHVVTIVITITANQFILHTHLFHLFQCMWKN